MVRSEMTPRTGAPFARVTAEVELFDGVLSKVLMPTLARLVNEPATFGVITMDTLATAPTAMLPSEQVTMLPLRAQLPWLALDET